MGTALQHHAALPKIAGIWLLLLRIVRTLPACAQLSNLVDADGDDPNPCARFVPWLGRFQWVQMGLRPKDPGISSVLGPHNAEVEGSSPSLTTRIKGLILAR